MTYRDEVLADNPIGYWRFEETSGPVVVDEIDDNNGTVFGADLDVSTGEAQLGSAVDFDGVDDRIVVPNAAAHSGWADFTIEFWIASTEERSNMYLISVWMASGNERAWRLFSSTNDGGRMFIGISNIGGGSDSYPMIPSADVYDGNLHHVAVVRSGTTITAWLDGVSKLTATHSGTVHNSDGDLGFGARVDNNSSHHVALLDEVALYNYPLSEARIQAHYDAAFAEPDEFDPANLQVTVDGTTGQLSWDASPLLSQ